MKAPEEPSAETGQAKEPKEEKTPKVKMVTVRALKHYYNGTLPSGLPEWRTGEVREIPVAHLRQLQEDARDNFEVLG